MSLGVRSLCLLLSSPPLSSSLYISCGRCSLTTIVYYISTDPITSVRQTQDGNAVLVSTLDSTIRLMDKGNGQLLQSYKGHTNKEYRIRSTLGMADSAVISGSEDGKLYAWDLLEGKIIQEIDGPHSGKVASAVAVNGKKKEWASAGVDGE